MAQVLKQKHHLFQKSTYQNHVRMPEMEMGWESLVHPASETSSCFFFFTLLYDKFHNSLATSHSQWLIPKYKIKKKKIKMTREELKPPVLEHKGHNCSHEESSCPVFRLQGTHSRWSGKIRKAESLNVLSPLRLYQTESFISRNLLSLLLLLY